MGGQGGNRQIFFLWTVKVYPKIYTKCTHKVYTKKMEDILMETNLQNYGSQIQRP